MEIQTEASPLVHHDHHDHHDGTPPNKSKSNHKNTRIFNLWSVFWGCLGITIGMAVMSFYEQPPHTNNGPSSPLHFDVPSNNNNNNERQTTTSRYSHFQALGFQIYTGGAPAFLPQYDPVTNETTMIKNPECHHRQSYGVLGGWEYMCYLGNEDPIQDVQHRLSVMKDAVERAYQVVVNGAADDASTTNSSTLKIFIAPEFYWRGISGAYLFDHETRQNVTCGAICHMLQGLEQIVADKRFDDWLFVFGTAIASEVLKSSRAGIDSDDDADADALVLDHLFYNFAPIYRGYDPKISDHHGTRFLLPKRYVSKIDFLTPQRHFSKSLAKELVDEPIHDQSYTSTVHNPVDFHQYRYDHDMFKKYKQELNDESGYTMIEYGWMIVDNITMTLEICYDHKQRTALTSYLADTVTGSHTQIPKTSKSSRKNKKNTLEFVSIPKHQAQISLVSSAGMQIKPDALALTQHGTIVLQDGLTDDNSVLLSTDVFGCQPPECLEFDGGTEVVQRTAILTETDAFFEHRLVTTFEKHSIYETSPGESSAWAEALEGVFSVKMYEPMITAYAPAEIAPVSNA